MGDLTWTWGLQPHSVHGQASKHIQPHRSNVQGSMYLLEGVIRLTTVIDQFGTAKRDKRKVVVGEPGPVGNRNSSVGKQPESACVTAPSFSFGGR